MFIYIYIYISRTFIHNRRIISDPGKKTTQGVSFPEVCRISLQCSVFYRHRVNR